ncbi:MAG: homoserine dehydrogenase [Burkholderiaceae bacterium]|nr:homoserine dehydrogenase [Burkholderiaceae bacterium]
MTEKIKIGMAGFGNVGSGTYSVLQRNAKEISRRAGRDIEVSRIVVRKPERISSLVDESVKVTTDWKDLVQDPEIQVVVEVMGGIEPARSLVLGAIEQGKHVVTANKALLAEHGNEIFALAQEKGVNVAFEAAVAGSIPIIKALREGLAANRVEWVAGIINGTCNFILSTMRDTGRGFNDVLAEAQKLGYAEADPTFDIEGIDTAHKTMILSSIAFGIPVDMSRIHIEGISKLEAKDIRFAEELGYRIKLLGITKMTENGVEVRVHPTLIPNRRLIANVEGAMNAIVVKTDAANSQLFYGKGAGAEPTGSAVIADLVDIARTIDAKSSQRPLMPTLSTLGNKPWSDFGDTRSSYYFRIPVDDKPGVLADIAKVIAENNISIESLIQKEPAYPETSTEIIMMTHQAKESDVQRAIRTMQQLQSVLGPIVLLRKEELR